MKTQNPVKTTKETARAKIQESAKSRADYLRSSEAYKSDFAALEKTIQAFIDDPYDQKWAHHLDADGMATAYANISHELRFLKDEEPETVREVLDGIAANDFLLSYDTDWGSATVSQCLGDVVVLETNPTRDRLAIFSKELGLQVERVSSREHGLCLIERAMRRAGIFSSIVRLDYYGAILEFFDTGLGHLSDAELDALENSFEAEES